MADVQFMLTGSVDQTMVPRLLSEVTQRVGQGARSLLIAISSPGGNVYWGVTAYNFLRGLGVEITTHNLGQVDSIAGVIYVAGDRRLSVSQGRFLLHSIQWTFGGTDPGVPEKQLHDALRQVQQERDNIATILAERTGTAVEDVRSDIIDGRILDAREAIDYGFAGETSDDVFDPAQEIVSVIGA